MEHNLEKINSKKAATETKQRNNNLMHILSSGTSVGICDFFFILSWGYFLLGQIILSNQDNRKYLRNSRLYCIHMAIKPVFHSLK